MNLKVVLSCVAAMTLSAVAGAADVLYVDINDPNASDEAIEGRGTEALPYWSISAAIQAAPTNATIYVKPGVYSNDTPYYVSQKYRYTQLYIDKTLRIESTGGKDRTAIEGLFSEAWRTGAAGATRWGDKSSRCALVTENAAGTVLKGFTFRNGATRQEDHNTAQGGGVLALANAYIVDSTITNCASAVSGGALEGGTAIRCLIAYNFVNNWDGGSINNSKLWNCVLRETSIQAGGNRTHRNITAVNCTFVTDQLRLSGSALSNCLVEYNARCTDDEATDAFDRTVIVQSLNQGQWLPQTISPFCFDVRLLPFSGAVDAGVTANLREIIDIPDEFAATDYTGGLIDYDSVTCHAGASQQVVAPAGGAVKIGSGVASKVDGVDVFNGMYFYPTNYPCLYRIAPRTGTAAYAGFSITGTTQVNDIPQEGNDYLVLPPAEPERCASIWFANAHDVVWADANSTSEIEDGSEENPYKTLQAAVDATQAAKSSSKYSVIWVKPGDYRTGGQVSADGVMNRVYFKFTDSRLIIRSTDGAAVTTVWGGTNVRGLYCASGAMHAQGLTVRDCVRTEDEDVNVGAAAQAVEMSDCVITNCSAKQICHGGSLVRCRVLGCTARGALCDLTGSWFCEFRDNEVYRLTNGNKENCHFCSITRNTILPGGTVHGNPSSYHYSNIDAGGAQFATRADDVDTVLWNYDYWEHPANYTYADPLFVNPDQGDLHISTLSPGYHLATDSLGATSDLSHYLIADLDGALVTSWPMPFSAGCYQKNVFTAFVVNDPSGSLELEGATVGLNVVPSGVARTVTVQLADDAKRAVQAYVRTFMDGSAVTNAVADLPGGVLTFEVSTAETSVTLDVIESPDWFVDAVNGNDANDGFTPETAKKTLADVVTNTAVRAGDVIHALPGTYETGYMMSSADVYTRSRVVVPAGVSLVSMDGKDVTFIKGADAPIPMDKVEHAKDGCGTNATRCAYLNANARLEGFTLTGGRTFEGWEGRIAGDYSGGGVRAANATATIVDCLFTDCLGGIGAAGSNGTYFRCRANSCCRSGGYVFGNATLVNCIVNLSPVGTAASACKIYNSFVRSNKGYTAVGDSTSLCYNSIIFGQNVANAHYYGCILATNANHTAWDGSTFFNPANCVDCIHTNVEALALTDDFRPPSADSWLVDAAYPDYQYEGDAEAQFDYLKAPRVMNRRIDFGAYEWDIRPDLAADLGRKATVDFVTANVVENGGTVLLDGDGARLEATLAARAGQPRGQAVTVTGTGVLKVYLNGTLVAEKGAGTWDLDFGKLAASNALVYVVEGDATAELAGTKSREGLLLLFR